jgi:hypothetical protein
MNDVGNWGRIGRKPVYSLSTEGDCSDVPTLKIFQLDVLCRIDGTDGKCLGDPKANNLNYYATGYNIYFDGETAAAQAASADGGDGYAAATEANGTEAPSSSAAMPLGAVSAIAVSVLMAMF